MQRQSEKSSPRVHAREESTQAQATIVQMVRYSSEFSRLFVFPIRIFRVLEVPQRASAGDRGNGREVVGRRGGTRGPFESPCVPSIVPHHPSLPIRKDHIGPNQPHT